MKRKFWILFLLASTALTLFSWFLWYRKMPRLLEHSTRIVSGHYWDWNLGVPEYVTWIDNRYVLVSADDKFYVIDSKRRTYEERNELSLKHLNMKISRRPYWVLSPKGDWLLERFDHTLIWMHLDGSCMHSVKLDDVASDINWLDDSTFLIRSESKKNHATSTRLMHVWNKEPEPLMDTSQLPCFSKYIHMAVNYQDSKMHIATLDYFFNKAKTQTRTKSIKITDVQIGSKLQSVSEHSISLESGGDVSEFSFSPDGTQIVVLVHLEGTQPLLEWLHTHFKWILAKRNPTQELWIYSTDGNNKKCIGFVPNTNTFDSSVSNVHWLPDSKHLSYIFNDTLYVIVSK